MIVNNDVKVSIIVPVYNAEKYIERCMNSILNQTYKNIEIILIDDGSTDGSYNLLKKYSENDKRIIITSRENKGPFETRIEGIEKSSGEYIMFVDADDYIDKCMIENMLNLILKYNADICKCGIKFEIDDNISRVSNITDEDVCIEKSEFENKIYNQFINTYNLYSFYTQLIRKSKIKLNIKKSKISFAEDLMFNLNLYTNIERVVFSKENYYYYVENQGSITKSYNFKRLKNNLYDTIEVYSSMIEYLKKWEIDNEKNRLEVAKRVFKEIALRILKLSLSEEITNDLLKKEIKNICHNKKVIELKKYISKKEIYYEKQFIKIIERCIYDENVFGILCIINCIYKPYMKLKKKWKSV